MSSLAGSVKDLVNQLKKQQPNITYNQTIHVPPSELSASDIYKNAKALAERAQSDMGAADPVRELTEAIRHTVEYLGNEALPAKEGWSWYDAMVKYDPITAQLFVDHPIYFPKPPELLVHLSQFAGVGDQAYCTKAFGPSEGVSTVGSALTEDRTFVNCPDCLTRMNS